LQDVLANTRSDRVTIELGDELDPCIVRLLGRDDCLFVVMPMRLD
jgi:DNA polymerase III sliding clamp (beta) subunit (PCNA family)